MSQVLRKQDLIGFVDSYKYDSARLFEDLRRYPEVEKQLRVILDPASLNSEWPHELRNWRPVLLGLIGNEIGGIAHPMLREDAAAELYAKAAECGVSAPMLRMICGEIGALRLGLEGAQIDIPQELDISRTRGEHGAR